ALGRNALYNVTTGSGNTAVGYLAGDSYANANNNTFIGYNADATVPGLTNSAAIGFNAAVSSSNNFVFGNSSVAGWGFGTAPGSEAIKVGTGPANGNGAHLTLGGVWTDASARSKKEDFTEMNSEETLSKIAQLPVTRWKYSGTENEYHIGPMADDFFRMFQVGDDQSISAMDKTGVLFLGVQALTIENKKQDDLLKQQLEIIKRQNERIERLECLVEELRRKL
ncbi:MAG TPA: tail fiber domain-containing protein, partial [Chitinophagales bacterium]|nr:tail fiber domain-containing protein [Chitinophagales bacterium]